MIGKEAIGEDYNTWDEEKLWKSLYYQTLQHSDRRALKAMRDQVEEGNQMELLEVDEQEVEVVEVEVQVQEEMEENDEGENYDEEDFLFR